MEKSSMICPVCKGTMEIDEHSYVCENGHRFDIASKGYVNLLLSNQMNAKLPGDNKMMVNARADFLVKGYYSHLAEAMCGAVNDNFNGGTIIDAGCGEGYYTKEIYEMLSATDTDFRLACIDISKFACAKAARRFKDARCETAVASIFGLPFADGSADMLVTMFAPMCREEFNRVLKKGGILIMAIPGEEHLFSLKKAVYDTPYKNETADYDIDGFEFMGSRKCSRDIFIDNNADIQSLFSMTPYYYKTGVDGHERVKALESLETTAQFEVLVYRKK